MTYYAPGQWNVACDLCGKTVKSSTITTNWQGSKVCRSHRDVRNPQDFVRKVEGEAPIPWSRPPQWLPYGLCTLDGRGAIPGEAQSGCSVPTGSPIACTLEGRTAFPSVGVAGCLIPGKLPE